MKSGKAVGKKSASSTLATKVDQPKLPWSARLWASVGLPWIVVGITSYTCLTLAGRLSVHSQAGLDKLRAEVPSVVYDRSTCIFLTALAIDLLNIVFERQTIKLDCVLLPAFIKGMASTTNVMVRFFSPVVALTEAGRPVVVQRYICWMHTTPSILMLLKMISSTITVQETVLAIFCDEVMVVTGVAALITTGWQRVLWSIITHVAMLPVVPYMHKAFTEAMEQVRTRPLQLTMLFIYLLNLLLWVTFAVTWDLALLGWITVAGEEVLYVVCDFSAKVLFSSTLMLSSFKEFEARRESAMRFIEGSSKAKLIAELQALLEQKERFMSSVSHELRTPLNGIIGISEGMLSGCCGVLPEGVRRQIYIIRTSGARLLALINDVMDAAALRQNKLVLKQEQIVLRHVVDDVLDLTRSLVDGEVALVNLVPPRMLVVGDTGRIVQILNNLLGNAAKFTRRGQIRVTARQVDGGRKVAVTVSDTGIGIPRNKLATIFLPFEQVDMSISRKYGGFGLGLNIVQELVKAHSGSINVSSIEGKGSAFTFTLPLARAMGRESLEEAKEAAARGSLGALGGSTRSAGGIGGSSGSGSGSALGAGRGDHSSATASGTSPGAGGGGGGEGIDDSSTVVSGSDASRLPGSRGAGGMAERGAMAADTELEQYGELMYNAAELSALASSRPYAQSLRDTPLALTEGRTAGVAHPHLHASRGASGRGHSSGITPSASLGPTDRKSVGAPVVGSETAAAASRWYMASQGSDTKIVHGPRPFHYTMYKRFLLLSVDDDPVNQNVIRSLLGSTGYEIVAVSSGPEALRYVATSTALPDLVLLDCMMPEMDGYEVLQRLRALTPNVHMPIIMVSAQTEEEHVVCGLDLGADDYVTKPFKRNELLARIRAQLAYGDWEADEGALETISSLVDTDFNLLASTSQRGQDAVRGFDLGLLDSSPNPFGGAADAVTNSMAGGEATFGGGVGSGSLTSSGVDLLRRMSSAGGGGGSSADQRLIVCIDDDDVNQVVLQGMLTSQQYRYIRASSGAQGLSYVCGPQYGGIPPDLVLLDCSLPDMTGFDVCRCIRQMYNKQQVPIIMLSARHNESAVVEGLKCGANTYVTKPFRRNELLARIRLLLRSRDACFGRQASHADMGTEDSKQRVGITVAAALAERSPPPPAPVLQSPAVAAPPPASPLLHMKPLSPPLTTQPKPSWEVSEGPLGLQQKLHWEASESSTAQQGQGDIPEAPLNVQQKRQWEVPAPSSRPQPKYDWGPPEPSSISQQKRAWDVPGPSSTRQQGLQWEASESSTQQQELQSEASETSSIRRRKQSWDMPGAPFSLHRKQQSGAQEPSRSSQQEMQPGSWESSSALQQKRQWQVPEPLPTRQQGLHWEASESSTQQQELQSEASETSSIRRRKQSWDMPGAPFSLHRKQQSGAQEPSRSSQQEMQPGSWESSSALQQKRQWQVPEPLPTRQQKLLWEASESTSTQQQELQSEASEASLIRRRKQPWEIPGGPFSARQREQSELQVPAQSSQQELHWEASESSSTQQQKRQWDMPEPSSTRQQEFLWGMTETASTAQQKRPWELSESPPTKQPELLWPAPHPTISGLQEVKASPPGSPPTKQPELLWPAAHPAFSGLQEVKASPPGSPHTNKQEPQLGPLHSTCSAPHKLEAGSPKIAPSKQLTPNWASLHTTLSAKEDSPSSSQQKLQRQRSEPSSPSHQKPESERSEPSPTAQQKVQQDLSETPSIEQQVQRQLAGLSCAQQPRRRELAGPLSTAQQSQQWVFPEGPSPASQNMQWGLPETASTVQPKLPWELPEPPSNIQPKLKWEFPEAPSSPGKKFQAGVQQTSTSAQQDRQAELPDSPLGSASQAGTLSSGSNNASRSLNEPVPTTVAASATNADTNPATATAPTSAPAPSTGPGAAPSLGPGDAATSAPAPIPSPAPAVRVWSDAAVLVVAVADYAGLCRMLLPSEMADLSYRMTAAFERATVTYGAVKIETSGGVMSAAVLPTTGDSSGAAEADATAAAEAAAAAGLRLAALHRVGRVLLDAAATLPVPGTTTCLQLQQALALGSIMGHSSGTAAAGSAGTSSSPPAMLYFGPLLAELLDLARRAPPMTIVAPDGEAAALRASGATADIRGPLFLEADDSSTAGSVGGAPTSASGGGGSLVSRRLWLVEAHPLAYQYLPPQLLYGMAGGGGPATPGTLSPLHSFLQRSLTIDEEGRERVGGASGSLAAAAAASLQLLSSAGSVHGGAGSRPTPSLFLGAGPFAKNSAGIRAAAGSVAGSGGGSVDAKSGGSFHGWEVGGAHVPSRSASVGINNSHGLHRNLPQHLSGAGFSRAASLGFGLDSEAGSEGGDIPTIGGGSQASDNSADGGAAGGAKGSTGGEVSDNIGTDTSSGGGTCITFSLSAAAAAVAAAAAANTATATSSGGGAYSENGGASAHSTSLAGLQGTPGLSPGTSFLYTSSMPGHRPSLVGLSAGPRTGSATDIPGSASGLELTGVGSGGVLSLQLTQLGAVGTADADLSGAAAEPHLVALRTELAMMRQQLQALQINAAAAGAATAVAARSESHGSSLAPPPDPAQSGTHSDSSAQQHQVARSSVSLAGGISPPMGRASRGADISVGKRVTAATLGRIGPTASGDGSSASGVSSPNARSSLSQHQPHSQGTPQPVHFVGGASHLVGRGAPMGFSGEGTIGGKGRDGKGPKQTSAPGEKPAKKGSKIARLLFGKSFKQGTK